MFTTVVLADDLPAKPKKTVKVLCIGNSFTWGYLLWVHEFAAAAGNKQVYQWATYAGYSLQDHWKKVQEAEADTTGKRGLLDGGKSLRQYLESDTWDVVTIQQYSVLSFKEETYQPFASHLMAYIKKYAPTAEVMMVQTWAYRVDDPLFADPTTYTQARMYADLTKAYHKTARALGVRVVPMGDAFYMADTHGTWGFRPDPTFDAKTAVFPNLPDQQHSLHGGYSWIKGKAGNRLNFDGHHSSANGRYLGGAVLYEVLFHENVTDNTFVGPEMYHAAAPFLRAVAHAAVVAEDERQAALTAPVPAQP
jgi:hypothetical protein